MAEENHTIRQNQTITTGHEYELKNGKLVEVHDWFVESKGHRFECGCGDKFNSRERAIEHLEDN